MRFRSLEIVVSFGSRLIPQAPHVRNGACHTAVHEPGHGPLLTSVVVGAKFAQAGWNESRIAFPQSAAR